MEAKGAHIAEISNIEFVLKVYLIKKYSARNTKKHIENVIK